jgi:hypothetical protein
MKRGPAGVVGQGLPEHAHAEVHATVELHERPSVPELAADLVAPDQRARPAGQQPEEVEGLRGQGDGGPVVAQLETGRVQLEAFEAQDHVTPARQFQGKDAPGRLRRFRRFRPGRGRHGV